MYQAPQLEPVQMSAQGDQPEVEIKQAHNIPLHFYRYLYCAVGQKWLWVDRRVSDNELKKLVHDPSMFVVSFILVCEEDRDCSCHTI